MSNVKANVCLWSCMGSAVSETGVWMQGFDYAIPRAPNGFVGDIGVCGRVETGGVVAALDHR